VCRPLCCKSDPLRVRRWSWLPSTLGGGSRGGGGNPHLQHLTPLQAGWRPVRPWWETAWWWKSGGGGLYHRTGRGWRVFGCTLAVPVWSSNSLLSGANISKPCSNWLVSCTNRADVGVGEAWTEAVYKQPRGRLSHRYFYIVVAALAGPGELRALAVWSVVRRLV
jgi:hypothetical protein